MRSVFLKAGAILYREGDQSDAVYFIEQGQVEVRRGAGAAETGLAMLGKGEILGEMGVIRGVPRSTTIVAATDTALAKLTGPEFLAAFGGAEGLGLKLLRMICERLSATNDGADAKKRGGYAVRSEVGEIRLLGASPEMQAMLGRSGYVIKALPFEIGRATAESQASDAHRLSLPIKGQAPQLSGRHFKIEIGLDGALMVRDLESEYGGIVNGRRLSNFERMELAPVAGLYLGDNEIIAGGIHSTVRFTLRLAKAASAAA
ncbi:MAG: cyclic nucleotide-binding domain-containing protein [Alphaproteobacteria bacterium]